jgi:peptidoglycan/LPS O-acetylase OafA/YrhL
VISAVVLNTGTPFPGIAALLPVASTALAIAGGTVPHRMNAESVLRTPPLQWLGRLSYSFYLWHWPLLVIPAQAEGVSFPLASNLVLLGIALLLSAVTYVIVERPVRFSTFLASRPLTSVGAGATLVVGSIALSSWAIARHGHFF